MSLQIEATSVSNNPVSIQESSILKTNLQKIKIIPKNSALEEKVSRILYLFNHTSKKFHTDLERAFQKQLPVVYATTCSAAKTSIPTTLKAFIKTPLPALEENQSNCGFDTEHIGSIKGTLLSRVTDTRLPTYKKAYALCMLAHDESSKVQFDMAMKKTSSLIEAFKMHSIVFPATTMCQRVGTLGEFLFDNIKGYVSETLDGSLKNKIQKLYSLSTFVTKIGSNFLSLFRQEIIQQQIKSFITAEIEESDQTYKTSAKAFIDSFKLENKPESIFNRSLGRLHYMQTLDELIDRLHQVQHDDNTAIALGENYSSFSVNTESSQTSPLILAKLFKQLPKAWQEDIAIKMNDENIFYQSRKYPNIPIRMRKLHSKSRKIKPTDNDLLTFFNGDQLHTFFAERRAGNRFLPFLLRKRAEITEAINTLSSNKAPKTPPPPITTSNSTKGK